MAKEKNRLRLIIDVNVWISYAIGKKQFRLFKVLSNPNYTIVVSEHLLEELVITLHKPKLKKYISKEKASELIEMVIQSGSFINSTNLIKLARDPKDDYLLSLSIEGKANYLITGDKDLLILRKIETTKIVTLSDFFTLTKVN